MDEPEESQKANPGVVQEGDEDDLFMEDLSDQEKVVLLNVEQTKKPDAQYPKSCIYYAVFGECKRGIECKNREAHNLQAAERTRKWLRMKLDEQGPRGKEVTLLRRDRSSK